MEEDTTLQPNGVIADPAAENVESELIDNGEASLDIDEGQASEDVVETPAATAEPATRSERREQNYIDRLSQAIANSSSLTSRRSETRTQEYQPLKYEEGEFDPNQLEADRQAYGQHREQQAIAQFQDEITPLKLANWADKLDIDNERVARDWSVLDPKDKDNFDPDFASEMTQKYLNFIGYRQDDSGNTTIDRPNVRWADFVRAERQNIDRYVERELARSQKNITKQATNTGMRPGGQSRAPKSHNVDTSDPNWVAKLSREEYEEWGRELSDKILAEKLGYNR